jgi:DNA mismatch repair protein MutH
MEREEALGKLQALVGKDLRPLADAYGVTVTAPNGKINKGWFGHTVEALLGIPPNSSRNPNGGSWELKTVPLIERQNGRIGLKETLAITMINADEVAATPFEDSHLLTKLRRMVVLARIYPLASGRTSLVRQTVPISVASTESAIVHSVAAFDLDDPDTYKTVESDYHAVQDTILSRGFDALTGHMGTLVQPRTKGSGHGSLTRAFYARTGFVKQMLDL